MPRAATGSVLLDKGVWYCRLTIGGKRRAYPTACATKDAAQLRLAILVDLAAKMSAAGRGAYVDQSVRKAAMADTVELAAMLTVLEELRTGKARPIAEPAPAAKPAATVDTVASIAGRWTSGELSRLYPDHVPTRKSFGPIRGIIAKHITPHVGDVPIVDFALDHAEKVLAAHHGEASSRGQIVSLLRRILGIAVYPLRLIKASPIPRDLLGRRKGGKALAYLYPDEDRKLLGCEEVPLALRIYYGWQAREGTRSTEAEAMMWRDLDLDRGAVTLDHNKTLDPRAWALSPDVVRALRVWRRLCEKRGLVSDDDLVFVGVRVDHLPIKERAAKFRRQLKRAGITRAELYERTAARRPIRAHDLRATFVTIALANGKTEAWISDRTGHKGSDMINRYRRAARTVAELGLGDLAPLDEAIPELRGEPVAPVAAVIDIAKRRKNKGP